MKRTTKKKTVRAPEKRTRAPRAPRLAPPERRARTPRPKLTSDVLPTEALELIAKALAKLPAERLARELSIIEHAWRYFDAVWSPEQVRVPARWRSRLVGKEAVPCRALRPRPVSCRHLPRSTSRWKLYLPDLKSRWIATLQKPKEDYHVAHDASEIIRRELGRVAETLLARGDDANAMAARELHVLSRWVADHTRADSISETEKRKRRADAAAAAGNMVSRALLEQQLIPKRAVTSTRRVHIAAEEARWLALHEKASLLWQVAACEPDMRALRDAYEIKHPDLSTSTRATVKASARRRAEHAAGLDAENACRLAALHANMRGVTLTANAVREELKKRRNNGPRRHWLCACSSRASTERPATCRRCGAAFSLDDNSVRIPEDATEQIEARRRERYDAWKSSGPKSAEDVADAIRWAPWVGPWIRADALDGLAGAVMIRRSLAHRG